MITRKDYLEGRATHSEYYGQFVSAMHFAILNLEHEKIKNSTDKHFNDIPLEFWQQLALPAPTYTARKMKEAGDYVTLAGAVCILKEAARQLKEKLTQNPS
jgi:hypothetical protein